MWIVGWSIECLGLFGLQRCCLYQPSHHRVELQQCLFRSQLRQSLHWVHQHRHQPHNDDQTLLDHDKTPRINNNDRCSSSDHDFFRENRDLLGSYIQLCYLGMRQRQGLPDRTIRLRHISDLLLSFLGMLQFRGVGQQPNRNMQL